MWIRFLQIYLLMTNIINGLDQDTFRTLTLAVTDSYFMFVGVIYQQIRAD